MWCCESLIHTTLFPFKLLLLLPDKWLQNIFFKAGVFQDNATLLAIYIFSSDLFSYFTTLHMLQTSYFITTAYPQVKKNIKKSCGQKPCMEECGSSAGWQESLQHSEQGYSQNKVVPSGCTDTEKANENRAWKEKPNQLSFSTKSSSASSNWARLLSILTPSNYGPDF